MATTYCDFAPGHPLHGPYHDTEYGFPQRDESVLFERLLLEINQAGLSWETILRKRDGFRHAYADFDVDRVADYGDGDRARLLAAAGRSEEHTSELQSLMRISYAVFCLTKKTAP